MKKLLIVFISIMSIMSMIACSSKEVSNESKKSIDTKTYVIGIGQFAEHSSLDNCREGFIAGLKNEGFIENENLKVLYDNAQTDGSTAYQIYNNYKNQNVDMAVAIATPMAQAAYSVFKDDNTPIIYTAITDPVLADLASSDKKPLGNITGTSDVLPAEKQLEMIKNILPNAKKIGILYTTSEVNSESSIKLFKEVAPKFGFEIIDVGVSQSNEIPLATDRILGAVDCLNNITDNTVVASLPLILDKANEKNIPIFGSEIEQVKLGCVGSVGLDYYKLGIQTGQMAAKVLNGENIQNMNFETIIDSDLFLNKGAIEKLNIEVSEEYFKKAKEVF
ncbi:MAG: ABC transporter substrate-binding protein [Eubacteriales bacterium]|nr:ABC transporter substrate-binding protein [Eubacteriales bacterium]